MAAMHSPTVRHRRLARELRRHREKAGLSTDFAASQLGWSRSKLVRFESARTRPTPADVTAALGLYGADTAERVTLVELAKQARQRGWWTAYADVFQSSYVALEDEAAAIRSWQVQVVPGLLQTEAYARAVIKASGIENDDGLERRLRARVTRKTLLTRSSAPELHVILDEGVLRRGPADPEVMREQLSALQAAARRPNVTLQVLPYSAGMHAALDGAFVVLEYAEPADPDVAYIEGIGGEVYVESTQQVNRIRVRFDGICDAALTPDESVAFIATTLKEHPDR